MSITSLGAVATYQTGSATFVVNLPTGIVNGTLLKMLVSSDNAATALNTPPSGWTLDSHDTITNGDGQAYWKFSRVSDGTDGATISMVFAVTETFSAVVDGFNGCDNTVGSFGAGERDFLLTNPNLVTPPTSVVSVTSAGVSPNAGDMLVFHAGVDTNGNNGTWTTPSGYGAVVQTAAASNFGAVMGAELVAGASGPTGSTTALWTQSGNHGNYLVYHMALKAAGPPPTPLVSSLNFSNLGPG